MNTLLASQVIVLIELLLVCVMFWLVEKRRKFADRLRDRAMQFNDEITTKWEVRLAELQEREDRLSMAVEAYCGVYKEELQAAVKKAVNPTKH